MLKTEVLPELTFPSTGRLSAVPLWDFHVLTSPMPSMIHDTPTAAGLCPITSETWLRALTPLVRWRTILLALLAYYRALLPLQWIKPLRVGWMLPAMRVVRLR